MIAVWFSCGAASAVAAKKTLEMYPNEEVRIVNNPVIEEDADNRRFLYDVEKWLGVNIEFAVNPKYPNASCVEVWDDKRFMSGIYGAPCTQELKKRARQHWENINKPDYTVLGFTVDETARYHRFCLTERPIMPVLIDNNITKQDCFNILQKAQIKLPRIYSLGFPNANCVGCVKATSPTYWNLVRKHYPDIFKARADQSEQIGAKLVRVNNKRILLKNLSPNTKGRALKNYHVECGIFCEEYSEKKSAGEAAGGTEYA